MIARWMSVALVAAAASAGCASVQARNSVAGPRLEIPEAPQRAAVPVESDEAATEPVPPKPAHAAPTNAPPKAPRIRRTPPPAVQPSTATSTPPPSRATQVADPAPPPLQTTANVDAAEQGVRALVGQARRDLVKTDYQRLGADRKTQYDTAKRFIELAEAALKDHNVVFAEKLATKAATLASLLGR
jgi:hypothetical protein